MIQELSANRLGVRREGITEAAGSLQKAGLIKYNRGRITDPRSAGVRGAYLRVLRRRQESSTASGPEGALIRLSLSSK